MQIASKVRKLAVGVGVMAGIGMAVATTSQAATTVNGAGASFPYPLYSKWISEYGKMEPDVRVNYEPIGSGGGINQLTAGTVDFAGSDAAMTDDELADIPERVYHIPTVIGAVAITYNLDLDGQLRLTPDVLADIFLGNITRWDDPRIRSINQDLKLPSNPIVVARRSDSSGTTNMFTDYLTAISAEWAENVGVTKQPEWPYDNNLGGQGNAGVAGLVQQIPGAIGYVEIAYAVENDLPTALLQNRAGNYVEATLETTTAAAAGIVDEIPEDYRVSMVNAAGEDAYPIAGFTYLLIRENHPESYEEAKAVLNFAWWGLHEGQAYASDLLYAPLPSVLVNRLEETLQGITHNGEPLL